MFWQGPLNVTWKNFYFGWKWLDTLPATNYISDGLESWPLPEVLLSFADAQKPPMD